MAAEPPALHADPGPRRRPRLVLLAGAGGSVAASDGRALVLHVVASRSDAIKLAPVHAALEELGTFRQSLLLTGQRTDVVLARDVFEDVGLDAPDHVLETVGGSVGDQTARALSGAEPLLAEIRPEVMVVSGAADSTLGVVLSAAKRGIPIGRLEAGACDGGSVPGPGINRMLMDATADALFAPTRTAAERLRARGAGEQQIHVVGSTAADSLRRGLAAAAARKVWRRFGAPRGGYVLVTLHRPANVDHDERVARIVEALATLARRVPVIFPLHPRTRERLEPMGDIHRLVSAGVLCGPPLAYLDFLSLQIGAGAVVTDSGTVQEETSALGVPCFTLRSATEHEITLTHGTNILVGEDPRDVADMRLDGVRTPRAIPLWDGRAATRIADALVARYSLPEAAGI